MELTCGGKEGGWMRIGYINNGDQCPAGWKQTASPVKACRSSDGSAGCFSAVFNNNGIPYQHVCGKVVGYQKGTPDGFNTFAYKTYPSKAIDGPYVDGVSITYGSPRKHLWTYACGYSSDHNINGVNCPCARYPGLNPPSYVYDHYYCESGSTGAADTPTTYTTDPLWDGKGCSAGNSCCSQAGMPYFYRNIPGKANDQIEARICHDQVYRDEGIHVADLELYVQ